MAQCLEHCPIHQNAARLWVWLLVKACVEGNWLMFLSLSFPLNNHTHTHTYTHISHQRMWMCVCVYVYIYIHIYIYSRIVALTMIPVEVCGLTCLKMSHVAHVYEPWPHLCSTWSWMCFQMNQHLEMIKLNLKWLVLCCN